MAFALVLMIANAIKDGKASNVSMLCVITVSMVFAPNLTNANVSTDGKESTVLKAKVHLPVLME